MSDFLNIENNAIVIDVLKEIGNIGAGNAATSLANLINKKVDMSVPKVNVLDFKSVPAMLGGEEEPVAGIFFKLDGEIDGTIMFVLTMASAKRLVNLLMPGAELNQFDEMGMSILQEVGNILSGAYVTSLSDLTGLKVNMSIPSVAIDMAGAILSVPAIHFGLVGDTILIIENDFFEESKSEPVQGYFFLIPDIESYSTLFGALGISL